MKFFGGFSDKVKVEFESQLKINFSNGLTVEDYV